MPRLYLSVAEFSATPLAIALSGQISQLNSGVIDQLLARCSQRVDSFLEKRLQAPGTSTLSASASAGSTQISVASTLTLDSLAELAVIIDVGNSNQEKAEIVPGGVSVTSWQAPYPGTLTLTSGLQFSHSSGAPVQYVYKEVREAITASQSDPYSEALMSQAAQLALAHLPPIHTGLTRISFVKSYPLQTVYTIEHAYSYDTTYNVLYDSSNVTFAGQIIIEPTSGYLRYRAGTVIIPQGMVRITYVGGYNAVPDDVKSAVVWYMADELGMFLNPLGAVDSGMGKRRQSFALAQGKTPNVQRAEDLLSKFRRYV